MIHGMAFRNRYSFSATCLMVWLAGYPAGRMALSAQPAMAVSSANQSTRESRDRGLGYHGIPLAPASAVGVNGQQSCTALRFKLREHYQIVVQGSIGSLERQNFLIDTGSIPTMVDWRVASKLGLQFQAGKIVTFGEKTRDLKTVLPSVRIGSLHVDALTAGAGDLSFINGVDAIVGLDVLTRSSFRIDYGTRELTFGPLPPRGPAARIEFTPPFLTVELAIAGRPVRLLVDTGTRHLVLFERRVHGRLPHLPLRGEKVLYHLSGASRLRRVTLPALDISGKAIEHLEGLLSDALVDDYPPGIDGVLGVRAIASRQAEFDFERNRLVLQ
jgi:predicted aspartyl protease